MEALMSDLVKEMRIAMDEVIHDEVNDIITDDSDTEMKQAIETAAQQILLQAPAQMILPKRVEVSLNESGKQDYDAIQTQFTDGHGCLTIPEDWLRLVELRATKLAKHADYADGAGQQGGSDASLPVDQGNAPETKGHDYHIANYRKASTDVLDCRKV